MTKEEAIEKLEKLQSEFETLPEGTEREAEVIEEIEQLEVFIEDNFEDDEDVYENLEIEEEEYEEESEEED